MSHCLVYVCMKTGKSEATRQIFLVMIFSPLSAVWCVLLFLSTETVAVDPLPIRGGQIPVYSFFNSRTLYFCLCDAFSLPSFLSACLLLIMNNVTHSRRTAKSALASQTYTSYALFVTPNNKSQHIYIYDINI